jgi:hypothetical protein
MIDGEAITQEFILVGQNPNPVIPSLSLQTSGIKDCCNAFSLKVLADIATTDEFKNDVTGSLWWFNSFVTGATLELWKFSESANDYVFLANLNNNTYGTFYAFGFFVNDSNESFIGYQIEWKKVLTLQGAGGYKVKCIPTLAIGGSGSLFSNPYCLKQYTDSLANGTVKIEYNLNHINGLSSDDTKIADYGTLNWYNSLRLGGFFGFPTSTYSTEFIQYNNGERVWVKDEQEPEYVLKLRPQPAFVHDIMRTDVLQGDAILITDYNSRNAQTFIQKAVIKNGDYAPDWKRLQTKLATVEVKFRQTFNNLKKLWC